MRIRGVKQYGDNVFILPIESTRTITIKMEEDLVRRMDEFWKKHGYTSRSEFIRHAVSLCMEMGDECASRLRLAR